MKKIAVAAVFLFASTSMAQFTGSVQLGYTHDSNVFGNYAQVPDNYLGMNIGLDNYVGWDYSDLDMSYYGGLSSYGSYPEQDNWNHSLNVSYRIQLSRIADDLDSSEAASLTEDPLSMPPDSLETHLALSGVLNRTVPHSGDFAAYANFNSAAGGSLRYTIARLAMLRLHYGINYTGYDEITSLSNLVNSGSVSLSFMPTRSVYFYVNGSYGSKKYYGVDTVSSTVKNLINMHSQGRYKGKGKGGGQSSSAAKTYVLDSPSAAQTTYGAGLNILLGQWKANGSFLIRRDVSGTARYISAVAKFTSLSSEVYDDPYSYQGSEFNIGVKRDSLIAGIGLSVGFRSAGKDYNRPAYDTSQTVVVADKRHDRYTDISIGLTRSFPSVGFPAGYTLGLNYDHIGNSSNDEYYKFTDDIVTLSVTVNLF